MQQEKQCSERRPRLDDVCSNEESKFGILGDIFSTNLARSSRNNEPAIAPTDSAVSMDGD